VDCATRDLLSVEAAASGSQCLRWQVSAGAQQRAVLMAGKILQAPRWDDDSTVVKSKWGTNFSCATDGKSCLCSWGLGIHPSLLDCTTSREWLSVTAALLLLFDLSWRLNGNLSIFQWNGVRHCAVLTTLQSLINWI